MFYNYIKPIKNRHFSIFQLSKYNIICFFELFTKSLTIVPFGSSRFTLIIPHPFVFLYFYVIVHKSFEYYRTHKSCLSIFAKLPMAILYFSLSKCIPLNKEDLKVTTSDLGLI